MRNPTNFIDLRQQVVNRKGTFGPPARYFRSNVHLNAVNFPLSSSIPLPRKPSPDPFHVYSFPFGSSSAHLPSP